MEILLPFGKWVRPEGLFAALVSSHPAADERVARIQPLMALHSGAENACISFICTLFRRRVYVILIKQQDRKSGLIAVS